MRMSAFSMYSRMAGRMPGVREESTSSATDGSPPTSPAAAAALMPIRPPVPGTTTHFAFFTRLPLTYRSSFSGMQPSACFAFAAQYAMTMGSVQPMAGTSSAFRILT